MSELAKRRHAQSTPQERSDAARRAAKSRWAKTPAAERSKFGKRIRSARGKRSREGKNR
jgi:acyl-CoA reductase-like NAD-dependent aldehyde dehydrogenase